MYTAVSRIDPPEFSIVTVTFNCQETIEETFMRSIVMKALPFDPGFLFRPISTFLLRLYFVMVRLKLTGKNR